MLRAHHVDLHIHSCLSPCAEWEMSPRNIVERSLEVGLDVIAVCDHNSAENAAAAMRIGSRRGLRVLPGLEICSREEVHILAVFPTLENAVAMQEFVYRHLPGENQPDLFGFQVVADENDEVLGESSRLLIGATRLSLAEIVDRTHELSGIAVASHVDRPAFGIIGQLGFIPGDLRLDALEVSFRVPLATAAQTLPATQGHPCVTSSDAHRLTDIGRAKTVMRMADAGFDEIRYCLQGLDGRGIEA